MLPRALCENAQQVARTQGAAVRHDRVERVAPLGGFLWIDILEPCSGGPELGGRDDGVHVQAWRGSTSQLSCASTNDARRSQEKDFQELFESDLARDTSSSSTKFDNCCLAAAVEIGRAHLCTPPTTSSPIPPSPPQKTHTPPHHHHLT